MTVPDPIDYEREYTRLHSRVLFMADALGGIDDGSVWPAMTCFEVDSVADLLRTVGHEGAAVMILEQHAEGDDEGDSHHPDYDPEAEDEDLEQGLQDVAEVSRRLAAALATQPAVLAELDRNPNSTREDFRTLIEEM